MKVALIFNGDRAGTTGMYLVRACQRLGVPCDHWWLRDAARIPSEYGLYLRIDHGDDYQQALPDRLRPAVFYAIDTHLPHSWRKIRRMAGAFDLVFCCQRAGAERLRGAEWLPPACDWDVHGYRLMPVRLDVAFVGTEGGTPRKFFLQAIRERYPNSYVGGAEYVDITSWYSQAKIGLNYAIKEDVNMRVFEVMAARALLVTNALRLDDFHRLGFEDRRHLVLYHTPREAFDVIDHYLHHDEERLAIAQAGQDAVQQRHTYVHRMQQLFARVAARLGVTVGPDTAETRSCASS